MKNLYLILIVLFVMALFPFQVLAQETVVLKQEGIASWYGREFEGRPTASGEIFDASQLTAAHPSLPFGTMLIVTNTHNNKKVTVRINDRGPFVPARIIDVSRAAAEQLDMIVTGTAPVKIETVNGVVLSTAAVGTQVSPQSNNAPRPSQETALQNINSQTIAPVVQTTPQQVIPAQVTAANSSVFVSQPQVVAQAPVLPQFRLNPSINIVNEKNYRLQIGSFRVARNAVEAFDKLKNAGLNPAYERFTDNNNNEYFRVVLAGISGTDVQLTTERLRAAGFFEAVIREEH
ncbi:MAG: septal ring lytic transglycosylase RlpA family protein [Treponema sp.]|nr:septal ring lytic transglycosylase RlpA family protein [Treponema sp.]